MLASIIASGLAVGAVYALIGVTYNTMFSASRVMSFTAGQLGMLGGVFGSLFVLRLGMPRLHGDNAKIERAGLDELPRPLQGNRALELRADRVATRCHRPSSD